MIPDSPSPIRLDDLVAGRLNPAVAHAIDAIELRPGDGTPGPTGPVSGEPARPPMALVLAIAGACDAAGCQARLVDDATVTAARYAARVRDRIKIRPGQLLVIDRASDPPEVVWRLYPAPVRQVAPDYALVDDRGERLFAARPAPGVVMAVTVGEAVWLGGAGTAGWLMYDRVVNGRPADPAHLRRVLFPVVAAAYGTTLAG